MTTAAPLMAGKKGLIMGLANDKSIAWGIAQALDAQGAQIAFSYQNEALEKRVKPLSETLSFEPTLIQCDVTDSASVEACFKELGENGAKSILLFMPLLFLTKRTERPHNRYHAAELFEHNAYFLLFFARNLPLRFALHERKRFHRYPDLSGGRKNSAEL